MLTGWIDSARDSLGLNGDTVKPITEGTPVTIGGGTPETTGTTSFWGLLDDLGSKVYNGVGGYAEAAIQKEIDKITYGHEAKLDTTGDPNYLSHGQVSPAVPLEVSFVEKYRTPLLITAGVLAGVLVYLQVKK